jgi:hypothetical protein
LYDLLGMTLLTPSLVYSNAPDLCTLEMKTDSNLEPLPMLQIWIHISVPDP